MKAAVSSLLVSRVSSTTENVAVGFINYKLDFGKFWILGGGCDSLRSQVA